MSEITVGTLWVGKNNFRTEVEVLDTCVVNGVLRRLVNGNKFLHPAWASRKDFLNDYEPKVLGSECERLAGLIEAAKGLRQALIDSEESNDCGEMYWAERMTDPVDLLIKALNDYEAGER